MAIGGLIKGRKRGAAYVLLPCAMQASMWRAATRRNRRTIGRRKGARGTSSGCGHTPRERGGQFVPLKAVASTDSGPSVSGCANTRSILCKIPSLSWRSVIGRCSPASSLRNKSASRFQWLRGRLITISALRSDVTGLNHDNGFVHVALGPTAGTRPATTAKKLRRVGIYSLIFESLAQKPPSLPVCRWRPELLPPFYHRYGLCPALVDLGTKSQHSCNFCT